MMDIDAVLFDLDDTLLDRRASFRAYAKAFVTARFQEGNWPEDMARMVALMEELDADGYGNKTAMYETLIARWNLNETAGDLVADFYRLLARFAVPDPDMTVVLETLAPRYKLGLVTNGTSAGQRAKIDRLGIRNLFGAIVVSGDIGIHKPDARAFHACLDALGVAPERAVYIGDHLTNDVNGALGAGMRAIWYPNTPQKANVPVALRLRDILDLL